MPEERNSENTQDKDVREMQDEAQTPGYEDDPHIESSNRSPNNERNDEDRKNGERS